MLLKLERLPGIELVCEIPVSAQLSPGATVPYTSTRRLKFRSPSARNNAQKPINTG